MSLPKYFSSIKAFEGRVYQLKKHHSDWAGRRQEFIDRNRYYYDQIVKLLQFIIHPDSSVLHVGCQTGELLHRLRPSRGVGIDISDELISIAQNQHAHLEFVSQEMPEVSSSGVFDYVLISNIGEVIDFRDQFVQLKKIGDSRTRYVIYKYNHLWEPVVYLAEKLGIKYPLSQQNWLAHDDVDNLLNLAGYEIVKTYRTLLFPKYIPVLSWIFNGFIQSIPLIRRLCFIEVIVAKIADNPRIEADASVSIIIPCKDEEGNIEPAISRIPEIGSHTEILFCDDKSDDNTVSEVQRMQKQFPDRDIKLVHGPGICKADNVWSGFEAATGDVLIILDGDLTVMPEELPHMVDVLTNGTAEFVNGSRMIYPMEPDAMRMLNQFGNKAFSLAFTFILGQKIKDTLCGTKIFWREDWNSIKELIPNWGPKDRWGDFDLIFGAAMLHLKITEFPVHYQDRIEGVTKMTRRFFNAWNMFKKCLYAHRRFSYFSRVSAVATDQNE